MSSTGHKVSLDFETRSVVDVRRLGADAYARHPSTEPICLAYRIDDGELRQWALAYDGPNIPEDLSLAVRGGATLCAHNALFERAIWHHVMRRKYGWPQVFDRQWRCTQAASLYRGLPAKLDIVGDVLDVPTKKDKRGKQALDKLSKPQRDGLFLEDFEWEEVLFNYNLDDVRAEEGVGEIVGELPAPELAVFRLDMEINTRGVRFDIPAVRSAKRLVEKVEKRLTEEARDLTGGLTTGQVAKLGEWLADHGCPLPDMKAETVDDALSQGIEDNKARRVLEIRRTLARSSTAKLGRILECADENGRVRGLLQYYGAATTGRWAGRLVQPQNFPRLDLCEGVEYDDLIDAILTEDPDYVEMVYGDPMAVVAEGSRGLIVAGDGKRLVGGDLSAIEAVTTAALAGEESKLDVFRRGDDPYCTTASSIFKYEVLNKKTHPAERHVGKTAELYFGFGGGVGAWRNSARAPQHYSDEEIDEFKNAWRHAHPAITDFWEALENAALYAVHTGEEQETHGIRYGTEKNWLWCRLPSGRRLWYWKPRINMASVPWDEDERRPQLTYESMKLGQWRRVHTYGGKLCENVVQATARDLLVAGMFNAEHAGLPIVLTVHDEIVAETDPENADYGLLEQAMLNLPGWAQGWPVRADTWSGWRYQK